MPELTEPPRERLTTEGLREATACSTAALIPLMMSENAPDPSSESTLMAKIEALEAGPNLLERLSELDVPGDSLFGLRSSGGTGSVGAMATSIGVRITTESGEPGGTSSESRVLDEDSGVNT